MKIGIIGAGHIGGNAAALFGKAGHEVAIANSRGPETLQDKVAGWGENVHAATVEDAAAFGDVVLVAVPLYNYTKLPADALSGKIVMDANNYYPQRDGQIAELDSGETTSSELLAQHLPDSNVVKAFNAIWYTHLETLGNTDLPVEERRVIPIAGDDADAKATVNQLIEDIGFGTVDTGSLGAGGRLQQVDGPLYGASITLQEAKAQLENL